MNGKIVAKILSLILTVTMVLQIAVPTYALDNELSELFNDTQYVAESDEAEALEEETEEIAEETEEEISKSTEEETEEVGETNKTEAVSQTVESFQITPYETALEGKKDLRLWYKEAVPTTGSEYSNWENLSLPIGNGHMGASIFGRVQNERIQFNEKTLWTGGPSPSRPNYDGGNKNNAIDGDIKAKLDEIYNALVKSGVGIPSSGEFLDRLLGEGREGGYGAYQNFGDITLNFSNISNNITEYERDLNLRTAIAGVKFKDGATTYTREHFMSYPDNVMVTKLTSIGNPMTLTIGINPDNSNSSKTITNKTAQDNKITVEGKINDNDMKFATQLAVVGGDIVANANGTLTVSNANEILIFMSAATNFKQEYPTYRTDVNPISVVSQNVSNAVDKGYNQVKSNHLADYTELFGRVEFDLEHEISTTLDTKQQLAQYKSQSETNKNKALEVLLFQYGRYLLIASSREGSLPANLQGVWNASNNPPWSSDYHLNVNLQMNYWPAYVTNLTETSTPLVEYVDALRAPGRVTAEHHAGVKSEQGEENGWMVHTQNTPFGWTNPGWEFYWGWAPSTNAWIMQNVYERYEFTGDEQYLRETIYPMLREAAVFWNQFLRWDEGQGRYVSSPSYSPEHGRATLGNTFDQELVWQLFTDTITSAEFLGVDSELIVELKDKRELLRPLIINNAGRIKEWYEEDMPGFNSEAQDNGQHRHISHLLGLYPGKHITQTGTPKEFEAARLVLEDRGLSSGTGWAKANKINLWARILNGNNSYKLITSLFSTGILDNMWDSHAPFQIDGNFGYTSGVSEMLLQSHEGFINPLPALPDVWRNGSVSGLVARGNFEVDIDWANNKAKNIKVTSKIGGELNISYEGIENTTITKNGAAVTGQFENGILSMGNVSSGDVFVFTFSSSSIPAPLNVVAYRYSKNDISLEWERVEEATTYVVLRSDDGGKTYKEIANNVNTNSFNDTNAVKGEKTYKYKIKATGGNETKPVDAFDLIGEVKIDDQDTRVIYAGTSTWNNYETGKYLATQMEMELNSTAQLKFYGTGIKIIGRARPQFTKRATISIDGVTYLNDEEFQNKGNFPTVLFEKTGLEPGVHILNYKTTAVDGSRSPVIDAFEFVGLDDVPQNIKVEPQAANRVVVTWNAVSGKKYDIYRAQNDDAKFEKIAEGVTGGMFVDKTNPNRSGKQYLYKVGSIDGTISAPIVVDAVSGANTIPLFNDNRVVYSPGINAVGAARNLNWGNWAGTEAFFDTQDTYADSQYVEVTFTGTDFVFKGHSQNSNATLIVDGVNRGTINAVTASGTSRKDYTISKLAPTEHTVRLKRNSGQPLKITGFEFSNNPEPSGVQVGTEEGLNVVVEKNSEILIQATPIYARTIGGDFEWSVTETDGSETSKATINQDGLLTVKDASGVVRVIAASKANTEVYGYIDVVLALGNNQYKTYDDTDENAVYSDGWFDYVHTNSIEWFNKTQKYSSQATSGHTATFKFNGTGVIVSGMRRSDVGAFDAELFKVEDSAKTSLGKQEVVVYSQVPLYKQDIYEVRNLEKGEYELEITTKEYTPAGGTKKFKVCLDAFKVFEEYKFEKLEQFTKKIAECIKAYNSTQIGTDIGQTDQQSKEIFDAAIKEAIATANEVAENYNNIEQAEAQILEALEQLEEQAEHFNNSIIGNDDDDILYGDVNSDGAVGIKDAVKLIRYLAGYTNASLTEKELKAADVAYNGIIGSDDVVRLLQYLSDWGVTLGRQK